MTPTEESALGDYLHEKLIERFGLETEAWATEATERIARCVEPLNRVRAACPVPGACSYPLTAVILWMQEMNAYAAPGRYVYITRELLQCASFDEPIALVLAHEMAHHDLGHLRLFGGALERLRSMPGGWLASAVYRQMERRFIGSNCEDAADAYALDLCLAAGFNGDKCLQLFDFLEAYMTDHRDLDGVFGPDGKETRWTRSLRGYSPLRDRRDSLRRRLSKG